MKVIGRKFISFILIFSLILSFVPSWAVAEDTVVTETDIEENELVSAVESAEEEALSESVDGADIQTETETPVVDSEAETVVQPAEQVVESVNETENVDEFQVEGEPETSSQFETVDKSEPGGETESHHEPEDKITISAVGLTQDAVLTVREVTLADEETAGQFIYLQGRLPEQDIFQAYEIKLEEGALLSAEEGAAVTLHGCRISDVEHTVLLHFIADGTVEELDYTVNAAAENVSFVTKNFSPFVFAAALTQEPAERQRICAVDPGINTDAVCSIMTGDGTVLARRFISFPGDKDRITHVLGRIRRKQREHGSACRGLWDYAVRLNEELAKKTAGEISRFARENRADVIVFEYLEMKGKIRGSKKQRLHMWRKRDVQKRCEHLAHRNGMRISRICAWNTSALAFDGSGKVQRDPGNHSLCVFPNGKRYNCDLSASYNIGARYFIRELLKPLPETARSLLEAKVPAAMRRISCVYADLPALNDTVSRIAS